MTRLVSVRLSATAVIAACAASVFAPAAAQALWLVPQTVSAPHAQIYDLQMISGPAGDLLAWKASDLVGSQGILGQPSASYALAAPGGQFGAQRPLPARYANGPLVRLGGGRSAQLLLARTGVNTTRAAVALGGANGRFGAPLPIRGASVFVSRASLSGDARGDLLLAWISSARVHGNEHRVVWASVRPAGASFGRPRIVAGSSQAEQVSGAVGAQGDMVVAFPDKWGHMLARVRRHGGRWGAIQHLGPAAAGNENALTPFVADGGRVVVAWYSTQLCEGGCENPAFTRVAVQPSGSSRFRRAQLLQRDRTGLSGAPGGVSLAPVVLAVENGAPIVLFLARGTAPSAPPLLTPTMVKAAYPHGLGYLPAQAVSPSSEQAGDIASATGRHGALVTWLRGAPPFYYTGTVFARRLGARGPVGAPEQVSSSDRVLSAQPVFNHYSGRPGSTLAPWTVAWVGIPEGAAHNVVRASSPLCPSETVAASFVFEPVCSGG